MNRPERAPADVLQLAFDRVLSGEETAQAETPAEATEARVVALASAKAEAEVARASREEPKSRRGPQPHGRRGLDLDSLPQERVVIDPEEVIEAKGEGYECIGVELGRRLAYRPGGFVVLVFERPKYRPRAPEPKNDGEERTDVLIAPLPDSVWPAWMADPSAVAHHIIAKYSDCLPLHRQETISAREGFRIPRSTQCGWLGEAHRLCYRVVDSMLDEARRTAFCIATDATGAPVRAARKNDWWHVFVLLADRDHVIFRHAKEHTSATARAILAGYRGHLLADAATIFDTLYESGDIIEVACWFHLRRYFWRGIATEPDRAYEALSLIARLFEIDRGCRPLPLAERTRQRAARSRPVLTLLDAWIERHRDGVDARGPIAAAITYYSNQRIALQRFLEDGRLRLDNNLSEQALRHLVLGRRNWTHFANETGLAWYTTFRSLIASCALHDLNPADYLEQLLRLAPHWPVTRTLELSPKYWTRTVAGLDGRQKAILVRPWELGSRTATRSVRAA